MTNILAIDIGGSSIKFGDFSLNGILGNKGSIDVPATYKEMIQKIIDLFNTGDYSAITISSPGAIDPKTGQGSGITAIDYIPSGGNFKKELSEILNVPVAIENDANCAGLSEVHFSQGLESIAYVVLGTGVGGCVIADGKVVSGSNYFGGEFGYIPYKDGTYSSYAGMRGLSDRATKDKSVVTPGVEIFKRYENGEADYVYAVTEYYNAIASLLMILKYTQNPEAVIFAGAVTNRPNFLDEVTEAVKRQTSEEHGYTAEDVNISISQFGSDANLYGAYANLIRNYDIV